MLQELDRNEKCPGSGTKVSLADRDEDGFAFCEYCGNEQVPVREYVSGVRRYIFPQHKP